MKTKRFSKPQYLYSVYRNADDALIAFDVDYKEAAKAMGMTPHSVIHLWSVLGGKNGTWTLTRKRTEEIEKEMNDNPCDDVYPVTIKCKCGEYPRVRYKIPVHWVECGRKKCPFKMRTGYFTDTIGVYDTIARDRAIEEWNKIVIKK